MCGIAGFTDFQANIEDPSYTLSAMLGAIKERGPDSHGIWTSDPFHIGHNRLAILDLTSAGHQPMVSQSGRYVLTYNGEVYNARELAQQFPSTCTWHSHSDTEVILAVIERDGIEDAVKKFIGMFVFALVDRKTNALHLVRDPIGIKPLYYGWIGEDIIFGSQIKSFLKHPLFQPTICPAAMALYFKYNYIPAPYAVYKNCHKLKPGHILTFHSGLAVSERAYWTMEEAITQGHNTPIMDPQEAIFQVESLLQDSVSRQLIADVPLGVFLSGGIDSSLITSLVQKQRPGAIKTFTIGFNEKKYNEAHYAAQVARHLGTDHREAYLPINKAIDLIPEIPTYCDEPFGDASQLPTLLVSQLAKNDVTVVLSGDGGDEFFAGYSRYADVLKMQKLKSYVPQFGLKALTKVLNRYQNTFGRITGSDMSFKLHMASRCLLANGVDDIYDRIFDFWPDLFKYAFPPVTSHKIRSLLSDLSYMQYHDSIHYLPDDILTKVDRCSMHVSLETRVPFLDHRLVELSWRLPDALKYRNGQSKWILRQILNKHVPASLIDRPKKGFGVPIDVWLKGPLKDWAMDLMGGMKRDGMVPFDLIEKCMKEHQSNQVNWQYSLWGALMWQQWKSQMGV